MPEEPNLQNDPDIQDVLKKFSSEASLIEVPQKTIDKKPTKGITFDTDEEARTYKAIKFYNETSTPKIVRLVIKYSGGLIKEESHASYVLLFLALAMVAVSVIVVLSTSGNFYNHTNIPTDFSSGVYYPPPDVKIR